ncbi:hypothetical protein BS78_K107800 [Paspalum vaginatum]|uniref:PB1-like domain-containing protein n=1 Tax=Paspalum vaginatum TaxID=158149 RepID=A0A9W8CDX8_9POAL|nr:hypothetical protein BS78_K107800 [Paspalum vaginatum]
MDPLDTLIVRFHLKREFFNDGKKLQYLGGQEAMSYLERDKVSLPEVMGHLRDHCSVPDGTLLHWLFLGKELENGLRALVDDKVCLYMSECTGEGGVADIYVEECASNAISAEEDNQMPSGSDFEDELVDMNQVDEDDELQEENESPPAPPKVDSDSSSDSDYFPRDEEASEEDEEAGDIKKKFKAFKKKMKKGEGVCLDDIVLEDSSAQATSFVDLEGGGCGGTTDLIRAKHTCHLWHTL